MAMIRKRPRRPNGSNNLSKSMVDYYVVNILDHVFDKEILKLNSSHYLYLSKNMEFSVRELTPTLKDLIGWGMLEIFRTSGGSTYIQVTDYGIAISICKKMQGRKNSGKHNTLANKLAVSKENEGLLTFYDFELETKYGISRPDVFTINPTMNALNMKPTAYEVKVTRSDFLSDMKKESKWRSYLDIAERLYYVCPKNLIDKKEIPKECGLIYYEENKGFFIVKNAKNFTNTLSVENMMRLMLQIKNDNHSILVKPKTKRNLS